MSLGSRFETGLDRATEERKLFDWDGTEDDDEKIRLKLLMLMFVSKGL